MKSRNCSTARDEPWPEAQARADEIVSAFDAYDAERRCPEYDCEAVAEIEAEIDAHGDALQPVAEAIVATWAVTLDGLIVKARAVRWIYRDDPKQLIAEANDTDDELAVNHRRPLGDEGRPVVTALAFTLQVARLKLTTWRYLARRATLRIMMEPAG